MAAKSNRKKRISKRDFFCSALVSVLFLLEWRHSPLAFLMLRENMIFLAISRCIFILPLLYVTWRHQSSEQIPLMGKLFCTLGFLLPVGSFVPQAGRVVLLLSLALLLILVGYTVCLLRGRKGKGFHGSGMPMAAAGVSAAIFILTRLRYDVIGNTFVYYIPALLLGVGALVGFALYTVIKNRAFKYGGKVINAVLMAFAILFLTFTFAVMTTDNLNYALDSQGTTDMTVKVLDKETTRSHGKHRTTKYYLTVSVKGEEEKIRVPLDVYKSHEIGEPLKIETGDGAFGMTYVIPE